jgi:hypothetical protein
LTKEERVDVVCHLLGRFKDDILEYGAQSEIARELGINQSTVSRLWKLASKHLVNNRIRDWGVLGTQNHLRHCFPKYPPQLLREAIEEIPVSLRQSVRSLAGQLKVAPTTLTRYSESYGLYNRKNCTAKPVIRLENRTKRVLFAIDQIDYQHGHYYKDFYDTIFIDEKWFRCSKSTFHYYMTNNEDIPEHHAISKNKIEKVMFLCAVGRPRRDMHTGKSFDGKNRDMDNHKASTSQERQQESKERNTRGQGCVSQWEGLHEIYFKLCSSCNCKKCTSEHAAKNHLSAARQRFCPPVCAQEQSKDT